MRRIMFSIFCLVICSGLSALGIKEAKIETAEETVKDDPLRIRACEIASLLDDRLLAAQVLISGIDGKGELTPNMNDLLIQYPAGGIMLFRYNLNSTNDEIRNLVTQTVLLIQEQSGIPPFMAVDHEGGTVYRFIDRYAYLPNASDYWELFQKEGKQQAIAQIEQDSYNSAQKVIELGINLNFAPVAEHLNDDNRGFMESRSYGPDLSFTADAVRAFVSGMEKAGIMCVLKHFPGSAGEDPHFTSSALKGDRPSLDSLVFPFASAIENGARAVMASHTLVPAVDDKIASLSSVIMRNWLREDLGFNGIIICDDFSMAAAKSHSGSESLNSDEAAVLSVAAGADMVLVWPRDLKRTHEAFISALDDGSLSRERLREAAGRVIYEKLRMGLINE
ncbi:MAG: glycoside hydrolase family 3 protein [Treponema sp.]|nr:glycoside hydrolase family 3 protein [Treponema sp.]